jgi:hypothetical protein
MRYSSWVIVITLLILQSYNSAKTENHGKDADYDKGNAELLDFGQAFIREVAEIAAQFVVVASEGIGASASSQGCQNGNDDNGSGHDIISLCIVILFCWDVA